MIPCWVADMDFPTPRPVGNALADLVGTADLGYSSGDELVALEEKWAARMASRYGWEPEAGRLRVFCDVVQAVQVLIDLTTAPGDGILLLTPSYPPLWRAIEDSGRRMLTVPAARDPRRVVVRPRPRLRRKPAGPSFCCWPTRTTRPDGCSPPGS